MTGSLTAMAESRMEIVTLPSGVSAKVLGSKSYDWDSIKVLAERGVAYSDIARHFKGLDVEMIRIRGREERWLCPTNDRRMRRELLAKQRAELAKSGTARDPSLVLQDIWLDRQQRMDEKAWNIVETALDGVTDENARDLIMEAKDLKTIVDVGRKVSGKDKADQAELNSGPSLALNIGFLRSAGNEFHTLDV